MGKYQVIIEFRSGESEVFRCDTIEELMVNCWEIIYEENAYPDYADEIEYFSKSIHKACDWLFDLTDFPEYDIKHILILENDSVIYSI